LNFAAKAWPLFLFSYPVKASKER
ncbi:MAG: hypothetical protein QOD00_2962, partial [Blastocatellia bacterium]|nr:hypothetical protein [Blastocatellia bacterium]